jgi:hypothetical protein
MNRPQIRSANAVRHPVAFGVGRVLRAAVEALVVVGFVTAVSAVIVMFEAAGGRL